MRESVALADDLVLRFAGRTIGVLLRADDGTFAACSALTKRGVPPNARWRSPRAARRAIAGLLDRALERERVLAAGLADYAERTS